MAESRKSFDVIIVGGGAAGASALHALTRRGITNVLLLEKNKNYASGSTGSWGSLVRMYHANPRTTSLARQTVPYYLNFEKETGRSADFVQTGSLYFLKTSGLPKLRAQIEALKCDSIGPEIITAHEGKKRFPAFQWMEDDIAVSEPYAGYTCPRKTTDAWIEAAIENKAVAKCNAPVASLSREGDRVTGVRLQNGESYFCGTLVLAAGAWTSGLMEQCGERLPIFPKTVQVSQFQRSSKDANDPFFVDLEAQTFGRPVPGGSFIGGYLHDEIALSSDFNQHLNIREAHEAKRKLSRRLNWIKNATLMGGTRAVEGYTEDSNGILKYSDTMKNVLIAAGWSCNGFTLAPWIGKQIASLVPEGRRNGY